MIKIVILSYRTLSGSSTHDYHFPGHSMKYVTPVTFFATYYIKWLYKYYVLTLLSLRSLPIQSEVLSEIVTTTQRESERHLKSIQFKLSQLRLRMIHKILIILLRCSLICAEVKTEAAMIGDVVQAERRPAAIIATLCWTNCKFLTVIFNNNDYIHHN